MSQLKVVEGKVIIVLSTQGPMTILIKLSGSHVLKKYMAVKGRFMEKKGVLREGMGERANLKGHLRGSA